MSLTAPLTESQLTAALAVAETSFPYDIGFRWALPAAVAAEPARDVLRAARLAHVQQWVVSGEYGSVAATFGLYRPDAELAWQEDLVLLNWFCVNPCFRGAGLGRRLWAETVERAEALGARRLVFYSSNEPEHMAADRLYVAAGCARRLGPPLRDCEDRLTFFDLPLRSSPPASAALAREIDSLLQCYYAIDGDPALVAMAASACGASALSVAA